MARIFGHVPGRAGTEDGGQPMPPALWDPLVRLVHWGLAAVVLLNGLILKPGSVPHLWLGWIALTLLGLRFLWGFLGPAEARFAAFLPDPVAAMSHLSDLVRGKPREYPSHNPAGAIMVWALWALLAVVVASGLIMTQGKTPMRLAQEQAAVAAGDWSVLVESADESDAADKGDDGEDEGGDLGGAMVEEAHEIAANLILALALLHVGGVLLESRLLRRNLVRAMTIGPKRRQE